MAATPWCAPAVVALAARPAKPDLRDFAPLPPDQSPLVSVILPARNEAHNVERCVRSILASEYPSFELIVVDDRSTDETAAIVERLAARDTRLRLVRGEDLPEGWYGKPWACWQGFNAAQGSVLLFTDADTVHGPQLLPRAVAALQQSRVDLVSLMPHQEMLGFWERAVQPFFFIMLGLRYGSAERINRNRNPRHGIANGQFILVTRDSYQWVGGHQKVRDTVIEDLMLGVKYLEAGRTHLFALADQDMTTRMYTNLSGIVEGWSKNFFMGAYETMRSKPLAYVAALWSLIVPAYFLAPTVFLALGAVQRNVAQLVFGVLAYAGASAMIGVILRISRAPDWVGLFHPAGAAVEAYIILRAVVRGTRRIEWKGRTYSHP